MFGPILTGEKIDLVVPKKEDLELFVKWFADGEVTRFLGRNFPVTLEAEAEWYEKVWKSQEDVVWMISTKDGKRIGIFGLHKVDWINRQASCGICIGEKDSWRKGVGSETLKLGVKFSFEFLNLHSLHLTVFEENGPSWRTAVKAGFRLVGVYREHYYREGIWWNVNIGQLLRSDWEGMAVS